MYTSVSIALDFYLKNIDIDIYYLAQQKILVAHKFINKHKYHKYNDSLSETKCQFAVLHVSTKNKNISTMKTAVIPQI